MNTKIRKQKKRTEHWQKILVGSLALCGLAIIINMGVIAYVTFYPPRDATAVATSPVTHGTLRTLTVNGKKLEIETVSAQADIKQGLGDRTSMPSDHGMLFVFNRKDRYTFWMRHMEFPLDILFLRDGVVVDEALNLPAPSSFTIVPAIHVSSVLSDEVLELNAGMAAKYGLIKGVSTDFR